MSLRNKLQTQLNRLADGGTQLVTVDEPSLHLSCLLSEIHPLACRFDRLAVQTDRLRDATFDRLKQLSETLAERLTYLLEPISPVELDREGCVIQLRSNPPQKEDGGASYYELVARRGGELALCRYQKRRGEPRHPISAVVTQEVLLRLADDFEAVLS
jgi:hypothetical protein